MITMLVGINNKQLVRITAFQQRYLFRRQPPRKPYDRILCCLTEPRPVAVLELLPGMALELEIGELRRRTYQQSAMSANEWNAYFAGRSYATAIEIDSFASIPLNQRFDPVKIYRLKQFPQNFCYVTGPERPLGRPLAPERPPAAGHLF